MQPESSLPHSQDTATEPCPEPVESSLRPHTTFILVTVILHSNVTVGFFCFFPLPT
jgi:hypothetical protein